MYLELQLAQKKHRKDQKNSKIVTLHACKCQCNHFFKVQDQGLRDIENIVQLMIVLLHL